MNKNQNKCQKCPVVACPGAGSKRGFVILVFTVNLVTQEKTKQEKHQSKEEKEFGRIRVITLNV